MVESLEEKEKTSLAWKMRKNFKSFSKLEKPVKITKLLVSKSVCEITIFDRSIFLAIQMFNNIKLLKTINSIICSNSFELYLSNIIE